MLLIGRKAIICVGGRRCTRRSGWRATDVGFMTSAAAEDMHNVRRAIFAARGACCVCRMAAIGVVRYGLLVKTTGAASYTSVANKSSCTKTLLGRCSDMANRSTCGALCNGKRARTIPRRRCGSNQAPQRHLGLPGTCPSRGQIPKPTKRKTARNASKQTPPPHPRTTSPKEVARAALAPNSQAALPGAERCRRARGVGQPQPWRRRRPRPSMTASPSSGSA